MFRHHHRGREAHARHAFGFHPHEMRRRGRRGERVFDQGDLRFVILQLIAEKPSHGYDIIKAIEEKVGGAYSPSPGVVYPTLSLLEEMGYVTVEAAEGGKKLYRVTPEGQAALEENRASVDGIFRRMEDVHARFDGRSQRVARAMQNLGAAVSLRMSRGQITPAQLDAMIAAIDHAAQAVETA